MAVDCGGSEVGAFSPLHFQNTHTHKSTHVNGGTPAGHFVPVTRPIPYAFHPRKPITRAYVLNSTLLVTLEYEMYGRDVLCLKF